MAEIIARVCTTCGAFQAYPRPLCSICTAKDFVPLTIPAKGVIYSMTTVWRSPDPQRAADIPYIVALVHGPSGGLLMLRLAGFAEGQAPCIGDTVAIAADPPGAAAGLYGCPL